METRKLLFGQALALILAATCVLNGLLYERWKVCVPGLQSLLVHGLMLVLSSAILWATPSASRERVSFPREKPFPLQPFPLRLLAAAGVCDFVANMLLTRAFAMLTVGEMLVFSAMTTPLAWLLRRDRLVGLRLAGLLLALASVAGYGIAMQLLDGNVAGERKHFWQGAAIAVSGAAAYAVANTLQEKAARCTSPWMVLFFLGSCGFVLAAVFVAAETLFNVPAAVFLTTHVQIHILYAILALHALLLVLFYVGIPLFLRRYSAVDFNLELLAANVYALVAGGFVLEQSCPMPLLVAVSLLTCGLLLYHRSQE